MEYSDLLGYDTWVIFLYYESTILLDTNGYEIQMDYAWNIKVQQDMIVE